MEQVVVKRLVGCKHSGHLVVVGRVDVLVNTVARELHLPQKRGIRSPVRGWGGGKVCVPRV